jgi:hypothetical protein
LEAMAAKLLGSASKLPAGPLSRGGLGYREIRCADHR